MTKIDNMLGKILHKGNTNTPFKGFNLQPHTNMGYRMLTPNVGYRQPIVNPVNRVMGNIVNDNNSKNMARYNDYNEATTIGRKLAELSKFSDEKRNDYNENVDKPISPKEKERKLTQAHSWISRHAGYEEALRDLHLLPFTPSERTLELEDKEKELEELKKEKAERDERSKGMAFFESSKEADKIHKKMRKNDIYNFEKQILNKDYNESFNRGYNEAIIDLGLESKNPFGTVNHDKVIKISKKDVSKNRKTVENGRVIWNPDADDEDDIDLSTETDWGQSEEDNKREYFGLDSYELARMVGDDPGQIVEERNGYALIRFHDSYSPSSEHPDVWQIRHGKHTVWTSGTTDMAEFIHEGVGTYEVGSSLRKEAKEHFNKIAGR